MFFLLDCNKKKNSHEVRIKYLESDNLKSQIKPQSQEGYPKTRGTHQTPHTNLFKRFLWLFGCIVPLKNVRLTNDHRFTASLVANSK
jgi:hypothetical protein